MMQPRRWKDRGDGAALTTALRDAHAATGDAAQVDRAWDKLQATAAAIAADGSGPNATPNATPRPASPLRAGGGTKLVIGVALLALAGLGYRASLSTPQAARTALPQRAEPVARTKTTAPAALSQRDETALPNNAVPEPVEVSPVAPPAAPKPPRMRAARPAAAMASQSQPTAPGESEVALLSRAERLLASAPLDALALLDQHAQRFADGVLTQEREVMRIDAERALGRNAAAHQHAQAFVARYPRSAHRHRFEALLGDSSKPQTNP